jgi:cell division protein FtsQ
VETIQISGQQRYTDEQVQEASGIQIGDNLFLLNKYDAAGKIVEALPYIEDTRINRKLPSTLMIEVKECGTPLAVVQDGSVWLISSRGKIVDQLDMAASGDFGIISGCQLLSPSVGTKLALATDFSAQQSSLLALLAALEEAGMMNQVDGIRMDDLAVLYMDFDGRFTVKMPYGTDYARKMQILQMALESEYVQDNMTGTFDMMREDGKTYLEQNVR